MPTEKKKQAQSKAAAAKSRQASAKPECLPLVPLRGLTVYPGVSVSFDIGRDGSRLAVEKAMEQDQMIFLTAQKSVEENWPEADEIYEVGCVARIRQVLELPGETMKIMVEGKHRARISKIIQEEPYYLVEAEYPEPVDEGSHDDPTIEAYRRKLMQVFEKYALNTNRFPPETILALGSIKSLSALTDTISSQLNVAIESKQYLLEERLPQQRAQELIVILQREKLIHDLEKDIENKVRFNIDKSQRDYFLREQMKTIQSELGEQENSQQELENWNRQLEESNIPAEFKEKIRKEISRLSRMPAGFPEASVLRSWVELVFELPWGKTDKEKLSLQRARKILNKDHYGLEKVKERILEYLAVRKLRSEKGEISNKGPILCLVGPPGVGKTSIAHSVAEALGRKYVRMSLGGVRDEAEIRGHRRTYIGAMPGRIINAIRQVGKDNPLILLDEIDKLGNDFRGDPSSALLEVLDPEQNNTFRDHYLEIPYDLSQVLFITTANSIDTIPQALFDRMEVVFLSGYTEAEKIEIAQLHLLPNQIKQNALSRQQLTITRKGMSSLISWYTKEAGVRQLERELAHICRRAAILVTEKNEEKVRVTPDNIEDLIGKKKFRYDMAEEKDQVGIATGLAWTYAGGDTLTIEVNVLPGSGKLELTGQLGDVMKESARAATTYIRSRANELKIDDSFASSKDIHIHVPAGAIPKDGPSAGITLATALASALSGRAVRHNVAMTGEITLRGRVMPIGGLKEKVIAASRAGIDTILVPSENKRDTDDIPESVLQKVKICYVENMNQVLEQALLPAE
jgi:ATP-dependent Lon protease